VVNPPARRFCKHCGYWLVTPYSVSPGAPQRRLRGRRGRAAYTGKLGAGTIAFRILAGLLAVALVTVVLGLAGLHPVRRVTDLVGHVQGSGRMDGVTATARPSDALPGHPASWVVDDIRGRGYATRWTAGSPGDPAAACGTVAAPAGAGGATASTLELTFKAPADVREIGVEAGLPGDDPDRLARWRPRTLELRWNGGTCQVVELADEPGLQRFGVDQAILNGVTVNVVAGYPPANAGSDRLDIGEITFWQR
jgi:hypothetical protein